MVSVRPRRLAQRRARDATRAPAAGSDGEPTCGTCSGGHRRPPRDDAARPSRGATLAFQDAGGQVRTGLGAPGERGEAGEGQRGNGRSTQGCHQPPRRPVMGDNSVDVRTRQATIHRGRAPDPDPPYEMAGAANHAGTAGIQMMGVAWRCRGAGGPEPGRGARHVARERGAQGDRCKAARSADPSCHERTTRCLHGAAVPAGHASSRSTFPARGTTKPVPPRRRNTGGGPALTDRYARAQAPGAARGQHVGRVKR